MHLNPGVLLNHDGFIIQHFIYVYGTLNNVRLSSCACRSVRPRLTLYVCQEALIESPLLERRGNSENGEPGSPSSLYGTSLCVY